MRAFPTSARDSAGLDAQPSGSSACNPSSGVDVSRAAEGLCLVPTGKRRRNRWRRDPWPSSPETDSGGGTSGPEPEAEAASNPLTFCIADSDDFNDQGAEHDLGARVLMVEQRVAAVWERLRPWRRRASRRRDR